MENDLISRGAFKADLLKRGFYPAIVKTALKAAPAVEAVEVVRCKDCKWYKESEFLKPIKFCYRLKHPVEDRHIGYNFSDDDYCSYGERKENG